MANKLNLKNNHNLFLYTLKYWIKLKFIYYYSFKFILGLKMEKKSDIKTSVVEAGNKHLLLVKAAGVGFLFGFVLEKSKVYDPQIIRDQMVFKRFIMLKMFLSALTASTVAVLIYRVRFAKALRQHPPTNLGQSEATIHVQSNRWRLNTRLWHARWRFLSGNDICSAGRWRVECLC